MEVLSAKLKDIGIKIGLELIPWVQKITVALSDGIDWIEKHQKDFEHFFDDVTNVVKSFWTFYEPIATAIFTALKDSFGLIDDLVNGRWSKLWDDAVRIVGDAVNLILAPFKGIYALFKGFFDDVGNAIADAYNATIAPAVGFIVGGFNDMISAAKEAARIIDDLFGGGSFDRDVNKARNLANSFANAPTFTAPGPYDIPAFAAGGIVTRPTLAMIGEAGPEAVVPLSQMGGPVTIVVQSVLDGKVIAESTRQVALHDKRMGRAWN